MHRSDTTPLLDVSVFYAQSSAPRATQEDIDKVRTHLRNYITGKIKYDECKDNVKLIIGTSEAVDKVYEILNVPMEPLTDYSDNDDNDPSARKRAHSWTPEEDKRLLYGITKFGLSDWAEISKFIGNGRNRSQCSQRWHRSLNPRICKERWMPDDDEKLMNYVTLYGDHAWTKVAQALGCRTDVQCRYRYQLITKKMQAQTSKHPTQKAQITPSTHAQISLFPDAVPILEKQQPSSNLFSSQFQSIFATHGSNYQEPSVPMISRNSIFSEFVENDENQYHSMLSQSSMSSSNDVPVNTDAIWGNIMKSFDCTDVMSADSVNMLF